MANTSLINGIATSEISFQDRGLQYGDGLFETIAVDHENLLCWETHLKRLQQGCHRLHITFDPQKLKEEAYSLVQSVDKAILKIIITRGQGGRGYALPEKTESSRMITLYPWPVYKKENAIEGVNVRVCDYRYSNNAVLAGIKHLNRLEQILARSEWTDESITEGIVLDQENNVIEGTMSNLFAIKDNNVLTPDLSNCGVEGVIRSKVIELANESNINCEIKKISLNELLEADEIFICNSIIGVWPVTTVNRHSFSVGEITKKIKQLLQERHCISSSC